MHNTDIDTYGPQVKQIEAGSESVEKWIPIEVVLFDL